MGPQWLGCGKNIQAGKRRESIPLLAGHMGSLCLMLRWICSRWLPRLSSRPPQPSRPCLLPQLLRLCSSSKPRSRLSKPSEQNRAGCSHKRVLPPASRCTGSDLARDSSYPVGDTDLTGRAAVRQAALTTAATGPFVLPPDAPAPPTPMPATVLQAAILSAAVP